MSRTTAGPGKHDDVDLEAALPGHLRTPIPESAQEAPPLPQDAGPELMGAAATASSLLAPDILLPEAAPTAPSVAAPSVLAPSDPEKVQAQATSPAPQTMEEAAPSERVYDPTPASALPAQARAALEAVLMVVDEPTPTPLLAEAVGLPVCQTHRLLSELAAEYRGERGTPARGFMLRETGGGWRLASAPEHAEVVERFVVGGATARLTQAALETLAVVAYRQPVTRGRVAAIRGVNVDSVMRTLTTRGLVEEAGTETSGAILYRTTSYFLERMGLGHLDELPPLAPYLPEASAVADLAEELSGRL